MNLSQRIEKEYVEAYKSRDALKLAVLRHVKTAMKNRLVETKRPNDTLSDDEMLEIIKKQAKQRQDSIDQYMKAGRGDLADREAAELEVLKAYLPKMLGQDELDALISETIASLGAKGPQDMGKVMGAIMASHKNSVDGRQLSESVKKQLAAL